MSTLWQPSASLDMIRQRATLLKTIRRFMDERNIMEVETPILSHSGNTDPNIGSLKTLFHSPAARGPVPLYLNTSPEFAMKRLLAAGSGSIYQISKAFRDDEMGKYHETEFSMLEWYRIGLDHHQLMNEVQALLKELGYVECECHSYAEVFISCTGLNPHVADTHQLYEMALGLGMDAATTDRRTALDFLFSHRLAPALGGERPVFIYDFPACQAALARIRNDVPPVAERFELFMDGLEIANGFHELCEPSEQQKRFEADNQIRKQRGLNQIPPDRNLISALEHGLPECAGVALGLDRLLMRLAHKQSISEVMTFSNDRS
jgi:elongation factor P--(R)-beta-lysine ligase